MTRVAPDAAVGGTHGFTATLTSFVGRAVEAAELAGLVAEYRLVTVTGPGGVGKSRLASVVARRVAGRFADGVWLVELAGVQEPALVPAAVAVAVGVRQAPGMSADDSLAAVLAQRQLLVVLDNCEHVLGAAAELCGGLLPVADEVRILATSREPLRVAGEARFRLGPLGLPGPDDQVGAPGSEAVALFADRARRVDPHFTLDGESGLAVARLVARLDGVPLAIELAAARVEALGVAGLADRLDDRFALLSGGDRLAVERHRSLAAAVEWSYGLLAGQERRVFRRLAVFPGPFTLEAAEAVAGADAGPAVLHLVDCSLLSPPRTGPDGRARYSMLETLRAYGTELAEADEEREATAALAAFAGDVAEAAAAGLESSGGEVSAARWLDAEDALVHHALTWALDNDPPTALRLAIALAPWWDLRGRTAVGYDLLAAAAGHAAVGGQEWCAAQFWLGALDPGDRGIRSLDHFTRLRDALALDGPSQMLVQALNGRADQLSDLGRFPEAEADARQALAMAGDLGFPAGQAAALVQLGALAHFAGDPRASLDWLQRAQQIDPSGMPDREARECRLYLAKALREIPGETGSARQACAEALTWARRAGAAHDQADCLQLMADLDLLDGRLPQAGEHLREAVKLASRIGYRYRMIECLDHCGHLCAQTHRWADAITIWAARAAHLQETEGLDLPLEAARREEPMRTAQQALGAARVRAAQERGATMRLATATEFALLLRTEGTREPDAAPGVPPLSARERELVTLVAQGRTNAQIAGQLFISVRTVGSHLDRIREKTGCRRRADLTRLALQAGLV